MKTVCTHNEELFTIAKDADKKLLKEIYQEQHQYALEQGLEIDGKFLPFIAFPFFMNDQTVSRSTLQIQILIDTLCKMEELALSQNGQDVFLRLTNSLSRGGKHLVNICNYESKFSLARRHRRVDAYLLPNGETKVIEVNQAAPLALHFYETSQELAQIMMKKLNFPYQIRPIAPRLLDWLVDEYQARNPNKLPRTIALTIEHGYPPKFSDLPKMAKRIEKLALEKFGESICIKICFPYEIKLKNNKAILIQDSKETQVDLFWRNSVYMQKYIDEGKDISDYETILKNPEDFLIINSTRSWLTRNKETFSLLWDNELLKNLGLSKNEIEVIKQIVPETHNLFYSKEKEEMILNDKSNWISKPSDAGFGQGVEFGSNHDNKSWQNIVKERQSIPGFVFQRRVKYPTIEVMDLSSEGEIIKHVVEYDFCPHHINGKFFNSALSRANIKHSFDNNKEVLKMNLVSGGHLLPLIMV